VGTGRLLVSVLPLDRPSASVGMQQLRRSLLDYMASDDFRPSAELTWEEIRALWRRGPVAPSTGQRAFDPDLDDGSAHPR
jgi:hypothetical protein